MNLDKKRWIILLAGCFINLCLGSIYAWSVFSAAMADYFNATMGGNITPGDLAIVYTIANSVGPITMISGGWFNDKFGPKNNSVNYGIMFIGFALAGYFGPQIMRNTYATTGAYQQAFIIALSFSVAGIIFTFLYRILSKR